MNEELTPEAINEQRIRRIETIVGHRTDWGTFEDEESDHFKWLIAERERISKELEIAQTTINRLIKIAMGGRVDDL